MTQKDNFICNPKNPEFTSLLFRLDKLILERDKQRFSDNFNHLIVDYNLDQNDWQNNFTGEYSSEIITILALIFDLWQQIQEDDLPFTYVKQQLDQKTFEKNLIKIKFKLDIVKNKINR